MEIIGYIAGALTLLTYVPQAVKTIRTRSTRDLSLISYIMLVAGALLWAIFGILEHLPSIAVTNAVVTVLGAIILTLKLGERARTKA